jgi:hypothetical protein
MCKILICLCNPKSKKIYIRCSDIETNKSYAIFISDSLFLLKNNTLNNTSSTIIISSSEHETNCNFTFRSQNKTDQEDTGDIVTMYSAKDSNVVIGYYLKYHEDYFAILDYKIKENKIEFKCSNIHTNEICTIDTISTIKESGNLLKFGTTIVHRQQKYICCYDEENNTIEFIN